MKKQKNIGTRIIHSPGGECPHTGAVNFPIFMTSTFRQEAPGRNKGYDYSRSGNPTRKALEDYIADLEDGFAGFAFASGMAAISSSLMLLSAGDHIVATEDLYGGSYRLITQVLTRFGIEFTFADTSDAAKVGKAVKPETRAIYIETPTNPLMKIADLGALAKLARRRGLLLIVDNTFMSPLLQNPHRLGADVVVHSATKYLGGHSDVVIGLATVRNQALAKRLKYIQNAVGAVPSPVDCWLLMRGMKTLGVRMEAQQRSAAKIAEWLAGRTEVERVLYPGLKSHRGHEVHLRQATGGGAMISFYVRDAKVAEKILSSARLWTLAVSLGAVESIITYPAGMTHLTFPKKELKRIGINERLIRLSVGLEDADDLISDIERCFKSGNREFTP